MGRGDSRGAGVRAQFHFDDRYNRDELYKPYLSRRRGSTQLKVDPTPDVLKKQQDNYKNQKT